MKIAFINGSPKVKDSSSSCVLQDLKALLGSDSNTICEYDFRKSRLNKEEKEQLSKFDVLVLAFPLYVDGIPSHLLNCLIELEEFFTTIERKETMVYSIVNCGFYEGHQNRLAIEMIENWCEKAGLKWGQGIGVGGGGMLQSIKGIPIGHGPKKSMGKAFKLFADNILRFNSGENIYITPNFPRIMYKMAAEMGWRHTIKSNGLSRRDLGLRK